MATARTRTSTALCQRIAPTTCQVYRQRTSAGLLLHSSRRQRTAVHRMRAVALVVFAFPSLVYAQAAKGDSAADVARGKYLVHDIAVCWTCHTPRGADGSPDEQRPLAGGPVPYEAARPIEGWATVAPRL